MNLLPQAHAQKLSRNPRLRIAVLLGFSLFAALAPQIAQCEPRARITGNAQGHLLEELVRAVGEVESAPRSAFEARRRGEVAANFANEALRSEGYYAPTIEINIGEEGLAAPIVNIDIGQLYKIKDPTIDWGEVPPDPLTAQTAQTAINLDSQSAGRAQDILSAESRALGAVLQNGYADAVTEPRRVIVDHADNSVHPIFKISAGTKIRLGSVNLLSGTKTREDWLLSVVPWEAGANYGPSEITELERRLLETGVYDTISITLGATDIATSQRPVNVRLVDRAKISLEAQLSYATNEGFAIESEASRYNLLGRADSLIGRLTFGGIKKRVETELRLPHFLRPNQTLATSLAIFRDDTLAYREDGASFKGQITRRFWRNSFLTYGANLDLSRTHEPSFIRPTTGVDRDFVALSLVGAFIIDRTDNPLNARNGYKADIRLEPTIISGDANLSYLKLVSQASIYHDFTNDGRSVVAARARIGALLGGSIPDLPSGRRLYAGGGGSVRGYEYQGIGPRYNDPDRTPVGGLSLIETSIEFRQKLTDKIGMVGFIDAGTLGLTSSPDFGEFRSSLGLGIRYDLGFAPLRFDIAMPLNRPQGDSSFQFYIGVGQSF